MGTNIPRALQFIAAYDAVARNPGEERMMKSRAFRGEWCTFTTVAINEMAAATSELQANGVPLVDDGRKQAAAFLEQKRLDLGFTMSKFFKAIASRAAAKNRAATAERAAAAGPV